MIGSLTLTDFVIVGASSLVAFLGHYGWGQLAEAGYRKDPKPTTETGIGTPRKPVTRSVTFDFDEEGNFLCANSAGSDVLRHLDLVAPDWPDFRGVFLDRFPDMPRMVVPADRPRMTQLAPCSQIDPLQMGLEHHEAGITVHLSPSKPDSIADLFTHHDTFSSLANLGVLRAASENAPFPVWHSFSGGRVGWANAAYRALDMQFTKNQDTKDKPLFKLPEEKNAGSQPVRISVSNPELNRTYWFDVSSTPCGEGKLNFAIDVHAVVNAESAQRNFVQTLAKTFAQLATGLAIFDRSRQLVLFNPALIDLTALQPDFLTARPNLFSFFDQLRNNHIMPEPKDYASWRERVADVVTAASDGNFSETWNLASGLTYRVVGRPHPDGAIAFLIEDISAEISLTRRFRSEMKVTQSAMDAMTDRIAIFGRNGALLQCNAAMKKFAEMEDSVEDVNILEATRKWRSLCRPTPVWGDVRDFVSGQVERAPWSAELVSKSGEALEIHVVPLASGTTMVSMKSPVGKPKIVLERPKKTEVA